MKTFIFEILAALILFSPLQAAATGNAAPANAMSAPAGQAPDVVTQKLSALIHAGKYAEAQQLTVGLLAAYPDDQRLIKAKGLLDKLLAPSASATNSQPENSVSTPPSTAPSEQLTGMDKID